jgi:hypothetical protein
VLSALAKLVGVHLETVNPERSRWYATPGDGGTFSGTLAEVGAYVLGYATAYAGRMPRGASTSKLLQGANTAAGAQLSGAPRAGDYPAPVPYPPIRAGSRLYAVGPGHHAPHSATDLQVYSTIVRNVRPEGPYSDNAPPELLASPTLLIELGADRPLLGFPKCVYRNHDIGITVHRSGADALRSFAKAAQQRYDVAEGTRDRADTEIEWALTEIAACTRG